MIQKQMLQDELRYPDLATALDLVPRKRAAGVAASAVLFLDVCPPVECPAHRSSQVIVHVTPAGQIFF